MRRRREPSSESKVWALFTPDSKLETPDSPFGVRLYHEVTNPRLPPSGPTVASGFQPEGPLATPPASSDWP
ncbi:MAG TPA: hypothetical protein DFS52_14180, partial [Myxococcales bacterium]|nr:hypothetical protein [Myxococcales bacterium]